jgi:hypothetical protein
MMIRTAVVAGLAAAVGCLLYLLTLAAFDLNAFGQYKYMFYTGGYALFFIGAFKIYRDRFNGYRLRGPEGILLGFLLNLVAALLVVSSTYMWLARTESGQAAVALHKKQLFGLLELARPKMLEDFGEEAYQTTAANLEQLTPQDIAVDLGIGLSMSGLFHTFLFMLIFKTRSAEDQKKSRPTEAPQKKGKKKAGKKR